MSKYFDVKEGSLEQTVYSILSEKAVSIAQQQAAGAALAAKRKGEEPKTQASKQMAKMSTKDLEDFARTKHKGLPARKEEAELEEKYDVKTAKTKKGKITVKSFDFLDDAKAHLEKMKEKGHKGIISQDGKPVNEGSDEEYKKFFDAALKKFNIDSPADLKTDALKKKFFDYVDANYKAKNESLLDEAKMDDSEVLKAAKALASNGKDEKTKSFGKGLVDFYNKNKSFTPDQVSGLQNIMKNASFQMAKEEYIVESDYQIYHKTYSSAVQHALDMARKKGYEIDVEDYEQQVAIGPRKPSEGATNRFSISLTKNGKPQKKRLQMQVYGMGQQGYELNMYIEEFNISLGEATMKDALSKLTGKSVTSTTTGASGFQKTSYDLGNGLSVVFNDKSNLGDVYYGGKNLDSFRGIGTPEMEKVVTKYMKKYATKTEESGNKTMTGKPMTKIMVASKKG